MRVRLPAVLALLTLAAATTGAQEPRQGDTPVFRGTVDVVEIDAFVLDASGKPVTDLTAADFEIFEDGKKQNLASFGLINIPVEPDVTAPARRAATSDVSSNQHGEGRVYVIAIDDISGALVPRTRNLLRKFFEERFTANDSAAIVYVGRGDSKQTQDFTSNRELLLRSVDSLTGGLGVSDLDPSAHLLALEAEFMVRSRMHGLRMLTEFLATVHGRKKSILYVTTGLGMSVYEALDYDGGVKNIAVNELHAAITAATRGNVSIYPIDPGGLTPGGEVSEDFLSNPNFGVSAFEAVVTRTDPAAEPVPAQADEPVTDASRTNIGRRQDLRSLAESTGGFALVDSNNYQQAFERLVRENSTYYVLGFETASSRYDGRFHPVEIRVNRPGLQVRTRNGYLAPMRKTTPSITRSSTLAPAVADALKSPIPVLGVPMRVFAAPYKRTETEARVAVAVEIGTEALGLVEREGRFVGDVAVALRPITADGKLLPGQRHEAAFALKPDTFEASRNRGVRLVTEIMLPPGRYQLRAAGGSKAGAAGSVTYDLEIPDFAKDFVLSGVSVTSTAAAETTTMMPGARPLSDIFSTPITAAREFARNESLTMYAEVYETGTQPPHKIDFTIDLRNEAGTVLSRFTAQRSSTDVSGSSKAFGFVAPMPLDDLQPGPYVLHVEATANGSSMRTETRDIQIRVR